jgi:hypothetical protein
MTWPNTTHLVPLKKRYVEPIGLYGLPHSVIRMIINIPNPERLTLDERCKRIANMPVQERINQGWHF